MNTNIKTKSENKKKQCLLCDGIGLIKKKPIVCKYCDGTKCIRCGESGLYQKPYETCDKCDGLGILENYDK